MNERRSNEHTGAKMSRKEDESMRYRQGREASCDDGESASWIPVSRRRCDPSRVPTYRADDEYQENSEDVDWHVVRASLSCRATHGLLCVFAILTSA